MFVARIVALFAAALCCGTAAAQTAPAAGLPAQRVLDRYGLERAWWNQATLDSSRESVRYVTVDEEMVCVQSSGGIVSGLDGQTGWRMWAVQLGQKDDPSYPAVTNDELVLVNSGMSLYALKKLSGDLLWQVKLPNYPSTSPAMDSENVYIGTLDGSMYAFELKKILNLYRENRLPEWSHQTIRWRYKTGREITTPPVTTDSVVNFASSDRSLYSLTTNKRELKFQFETDAPISAPLAYSDRLLFLASEDSTLYCLDAKNGTAVWDRVFGLPLRQAPVVIGPDLYVMPVRGGIFAFRAESDVVRWWRPKITGVLGASRTVLYVSDELGNMILLSRENGAVLGALPLRDFSIRVVNDRTDRLYLATRAGLVMCLREKGSEFPLYYKFPDRRPILPEFFDPGAAPADGNPP